MKLPAILRKEFQEFILTKADNFTILQLAVCICKMKHEE